MIASQVMGEEQWRGWRVLRLEALADSPETFGATLAQWSGAGDREERWRTRLRDVALNVVLELDAQPAGMVSASAPGHDDAVELTSLWVAPRARGRGVGGAAVDSVLAWARREHPGAPVMLSVRTANVSAVRLYQRHGFVDAGPDVDDPALRRMSSR